MDRIRNWIPYYLGRIDDEHCESETAVGIRFPNVLKKSKTNWFEGEYPSIAAAMVTRVDGVCLRYHFRYDDTIRVAESFEGVVMRLYKHPQGFSIEGFEDDYSKQEIEFLNKFQELYLNAIKRYEYEE